MNADVFDNSGIRFFYTTQQPEKEAGILAIGSAINQAMIIPPRTENFTINGICSTDCTNAVRLNLADL